MSNFTSDTYTLKRKILTFSNKFSHELSKPKKKFFADIVYGMLAAGSCILTDVVDQLHENSKKANIVERLSRHLASGTPISSLRAYLKWVRKVVPNEPIVHVDDSDIVKPNGYKFEALGTVRDGSESSSGKSVYKKGYTVTEVTALTKKGNPISVFSKIHSSHEKGYSSTNTITFAAIKRVAKLFGKALFVMDRGYDDNKIFLMLEELKQNYVIRITRSRKLFLHNKWVSASELCNRRKGKIKISVFYDNKEHTAYLSHVKAKITASRKNVNLVLVYGITEHPMMLVTNKDIHSKDDVINIAKTYFSRWRIEEYFRCKKQVFKFEHFRVRKLKAINALNFYITIAMAFLAVIAEQNEVNALKVAIIKRADPIKAKVFFTFYRIAKGIRGILAYAKEGVRHWFKTRRPTYQQIRFSMIS
jgi:hypothetical protein